MRNLHCSLCCGHRLLCYWLCLSLRLYSMKTECPSEILVSITDIRSVLLHCLIEAESVFIAFLARSKHQLLELLSCADLRPVRNKRIVHCIYSITCHIMICLFIILLKPIIQGIMFLSTLWFTSRSLGSILLLCCLTGYGRTLCTCGGCFILASPVVRSLCGYRG